MSKQLLMFLSAISFTFPPLFAQTSPAPADQPLWRNPAKSPDERAKDLLKLLTLDEKIALLHADGTFSTAGVPRLGVPKLWMSDGPQGVREEINAVGFGNANHTDDFSTALPADISLAASFDPDLGKAFGNVIGQEALARHKNIMLCPGLNIMRTPLNGRNSEYLGEDPYLSSRMAVGFINGVQQNGVAACAKHYALNNQENNRSSVNVHVDERTMREIYLPAFKAAVTEAHTWAVMTAYNRVNGQYCSENDFLLNQVLKKDWGFQGLVMTDWGGAHSTVPCALNGLDLEMGSNINGNHNADFLAAPLLAAVNNNQVPLDRINDMALRNLRVMAATGLLDPPGTTRPATPGLLAPEHLEAARKIAEGGIVLLRNQNNVLPLDFSKLTSIAIIGDNAKAKFARDGNSATIKTTTEITPFDGISKAAADAVAGGFKDIKITYAQGYTRQNAGGGRRGGGGAPAGPGGGNQQLIDEAVANAKAADVAIIVAGLYRAQDQEGADRPNMNLPPGQSELIQAVTKANPKTIVILNGGSPSDVDPWLNDSAALLMYWYGGSEGGTALANVLTGKVNPSGHLPCTWPKQLADTPASNPNDPNIFPGTGAAGRGGGNLAATPTAGPQETYAEGLYVGYRWYDKKQIEPQFPFGFGLSYTTFELSNIKVTPNEVGVWTYPITANPPHGDPTGVTVEVTIKNTGPREGAQVIQLYVEDTHAPLDRPIHELKAFQKVTLKPAEQKTISIDLPLTAFEYFNPGSKQWEAAKGDFTLHVGTSSRDLPLKATFTLLKNLPLPPIPTLPFTVPNPPVTVPY